MRSIVFCPPSHGTGGTEALHQLVDSIRRQGGSSFLCFLPEDPTNESPTQFSAYDVGYLSLSDIQDNDLLIFPESMTKYMPRFPNNRTAIWWLSIGNHLGLHSIPASSWYYRLRAAKKMLRTPRESATSFLAVRKADLHLAQSAYALKSLKRLRLKGSMLSDFSITSASAAEDPPDNPGTRSDVIAINGSKGIRQAERFQELNPDLQTFILKGFTKDELSDFLRESKLYIDFGHHPGKDRLPREAAVAGCVVFVAEHGAARNRSDVPLPDRQRFSYRKNSLLELGERARHAMAEPGPFLADQASYVANIHRERNIFDAEVATSLSCLFDSTTPAPAPAPAPAPEKDSKQS